MQVIRKIGNRHIPNALKPTFEEAEQAEQADAAQGENLSQSYFYVYRGGMAYLNGSKAMTLALSALKSRLSGGLGQRCRFTEQVALECAAADR